MLMISEQFGGMDICVFARSATMQELQPACWLLMCQCQVLLNTLKQVPKLGLDLCQRMHQTLHAPGFTVVKLLNLWVLHRGV